MTPVLICIENYLAGGTERFAFDLVTGLADVYEGDSLTLQLPKRTFDVVLSLGVIEQLR